MSFQYVLIIFLIIRGMMFSECVGEEWLVIINTYGVLGSNMGVLWGYYIIAVMGISWNIIDRKVISFDV